MEKLIKRITTWYTVKYPNGVALVNDQLDAQFFYFILHLLESFNVSSNVMLIIRRPNFINTASGIVTFCK